MEIIQGLKHLDIGKALRINSLKMVCLSVLSGILVLLNIYKPIIFSRIIDNGLIKGDWNYIWWQCFWFLVIAASLFISSLLSRVLTSMISNTLGLEMRSTLLRRIFKTEYRLFIEANTGDVLNRIDGDVGNIRGYVLSILNTATGSFLGFVSALIYIGVVQWKMIVVGFIMTPFVAICLFVFRKKMYELNRRKRELQSTVYEGIIVGIDKQIDLRSLGLKNYFLSDILRTYIKFKNASVKNDGVEALNSGIIKLLTALGYIVTIAFGSWLVLNNQLSIGHLFAFLTLRSRFLAPIDFVGEVYQGFYVTKASFERLLFFFSYPLDEPERLKAEQDICPDSGSEDLLNLNVRNIVFRFKEDIPLLEGIDAAFGHGWTSIEGLNGTGKTTFVHLILGVLNPRHGEINLYGTNSKTITKEDWGEFFSYCSQTPFLFHGTLRENVSILNPKATDTEIRRTLEMFNFNLENGNEIIDLDRKHFPRWEKFVSRSETEGRSSKDIFEEGENLYF